VNRLSLSGVVASETEMRVAADGTPFLIATLGIPDATITLPDGSLKAATQFFRLVLIGQIAERFAVEQRRGKGVTVQGRVQTRLYSERARIRHSIEIVVERYVWTGQGDGETEGADAHPRG
jgi:single-stranded DNA-binding protein